MKTNVETLLKEEMLKRWAGRQLTVAVADLNGDALDFITLAADAFEASGSKATLTDAVSFQNTDDTTMNIHYIVITRTSIELGTQSATNIIDPNQADIVWDLEESVPVQTWHSFTIRSIEAEIGDSQ